MSMNLSKPLMSGRMTPSNMSSLQTVVIGEKKNYFNDSGSMHMSNEMKILLNLKYYLEIKYN